MMMRLKRRNLGADPGIISRSAYGDYEGPRDASGRPIIGIVPWDYVMVTEKPPTLSTGTATPGVPTEASGSVQPIAPDTASQMEKFPTITPEPKKSSMIMPLAVLAIGAMLLKGD